MKVADIGERFAREVKVLYASASTTEETYYPLLRDLCAALLEARRLPFQVRVNTSEHRAMVGGTDRPDLAFYERNDFVAVFGEVKLPTVGLADLALSLDRDNQIGRYLLQTGVVLLFNVRSIGLLACRAGYQRRPGEPVRVGDRELLDSVDLWPSESALRKGQPIPESALEAAADLVERAVTEFAPIATPSSLALILARQARRARADLPLRFETVQTLLADYKTALGLSFTEAAGEDFFRSSLIQTAFYALFAGWTLWHRKADDRPFEWEHLDDYLRIPFLGKLFYEFKHPDRLAELGLAKHLDRAAETLARVDRAAFFGGFTYGAWREPDGGQADSATAITYFYEPFLEAFDPELRKELGVWYTPPEIVRYQVRKADALLREQLGCRRGFADERVVVLDPCCGTGAYLLEVINCIAEELLARGDEAILAATLLQAITQRVIGFEILTAPFVIAQLQIYLLLADLGVPPKPTDRPAVFLTNALTGWSEAEQIRLNFPELQQEHEAAREIKRHAPILVVLGNPPYNRFAGTALAEESDLVDHYKGITRRPKRDRAGNQVRGRDGRPELVQDGESALYARWGVRKQLLDDLYIRFFRLAERRIGELGQRGIVSFISNSSFITGRSHPMMRESLLGNFDELWIDNLNGDKYRTGKIIPSGELGEGTADQSAFTTERDSRGIQVGTAITTLLRSKSDKVSAQPARVWYRDFWGKAKAKRHALLESLTAGGKQDGGPRVSRPEGPRDYEEIAPTATTRWMLCPRDENVGFESWPAVDELFPTSYQGVNPNRGLEGSLIDMSREGVSARMSEYFGSDDNPAFARKHPVLMTRRARYEPDEVRSRLRRLSAYRPERVVPYLLFPLDLRWVYYETSEKLLNERRPEFWDNLSDNEFLITVPQPRRVSESLPLVSRTLVDLHVHDRGSVCFPAWTRRGGGLYAHEGPNLAPSVQRVLTDTWRASAADDTTSHGIVTRLFRAGMALMHSPQYQEDHAEALAQDWAHLPLPRNPAVLDQLVAEGNRVTALLDPTADVDAVVEHALDPAVARALAVLRTTSGSPISGNDLTVDVSYFGAAKGRWIERPFLGSERVPPELGEATGDLYLNDDVFLAHVPRAVWQFELGGYPVIKKWLGYRHIERLHRPLTLAEARHLRSIVQRLTALIAMGPTLDRLYEISSADALTAEQLGLRVG